MPPVPGLIALVPQESVAGELRCVCKEDILAPYGKDARDRHQALCDVLRVQFGIMLSLPDFCINDADENGALFFINALDFACVDVGNSLMVVTCGYSLPEQDSERKEKLRFDVEPSSVKFDVIECL
jgi:hypothetical protein